MVKEQGRTFVLAMFLYNILVNSALRCCENLSYADICILYAGFLRSFSGICSRLFTFIHVQFLLQAELGFGNRSGGDTIKDS